MGVQWVLLWVWNRGDKVGELKCQPCHNVRRVVIHQSSQRPGDNSSVAPALYTYIVGNELVRYSLRSIPSTLATFISECMNKRPLPIGTKTGGWMTPQAAGEL